MSEKIEPLWTAAELGAFLGYAERTVVRMASSHPGRLPPRAPTHMLRWVPEVCRTWAASSAAAMPAPAPKPKRGRPRKQVAA